MSGQPESPRPLRILLVEDDATSRQAVNSVAKTLGHQTYVAEDMRQALDLVVSENEAFDLLLSDISLPDGDGWELLRCLSEADLRPRRSISISSRCTIPDLARSQEAGVDHHICKPVELAGLEAILREAAGGSDAVIPLDPFEG